ncbi:hypothetical protein, partial [Halalkalibaculum sp. DA384]|uniref:hypothetical protein n=1 Tax=Halalkalibaculum sp. DA384 TaxID=3373606 RepID=UPI003754F633
MIRRPPLPLVLAAAVLLLAASTEMANADTHPAPGPAHLEEDSLRVLVFSGTGWYRHAEIP